MRGKMFQSFLTDYYLIIKALHVISIICWMAGLLYLPRLFVYHSQVEKGSHTSETFKIMERRLSRAIITPAMILSFVFGFFMIIAEPSVFSHGWFHLKLTAIFLLVLSHGMMMRSLKAFSRDQNQSSPLFFRFLNEAPTVLMVVIVFMVIVKPF